MVRSIDTESLIRAPFHQRSHRNFNAKISHISYRIAICVSSNIASPIWVAIFAHRQYWGYFAFHQKSHIARAPGFFAIFCLKHAITQTQSQTVKKNQYSRRVVFLWKITREEESGSSGPVWKGGVRDIDFVNRYRVNRATAQELVELLGQDLARSERGGKTISPETKVTLMPSTGTVRFCQIFMNFYKMC